LLEAGPAPTVESGRTGTHQDEVTERRRIGDDGRAGHEAAQGVTDHVHARAEAGSYLAHTRAEGVECVGSGIGRAGGLELTGQVDGGHLETDAGNRVEDRAEVLLATRIAGDQQDGRIAGRTGLQGGDRGARKLDRHPHRYTVVDAPASTKPVPNG